MQLLTPKTHQIMKAEDKSKLVEIFHGSLWEAELVKGLLTDRGIKADTQNGLLINSTLPETAIDVVVVVNENDYEAAMEVIRERDKELNPD